MLSNEPKNPFADLVRKMNLVSDEPETNNILFRFNIHATHLADFIEYDDMPTPFAIAIHGEWGSGKTTFCKLVKKKLDNTKKIRTLEFNAWEYERSDIFVALLFLIKKEFNTDNKSRFAKSIISFGTDAILRRTVSMSKKDMTKHFRDFTVHISTLKKDLEGIIDHKLVIFIDDLDRCNVENTLSMLEGIKMFLNIKNIIFVVAVDMTKIERAWALRYNSSNSFDADIAMTEGRNHVEKMFQLKLSLPYKWNNSLQAYIRDIIKSLNDESIKFLINNLPPNPRKIKRTLNLISFILHSYDEVFIPDRATDSQYLNTLITWIIITNNYPYLVDFVKDNFDSLIHAAIVCTKFEHLDALKTHKTKIQNAINKPCTSFRYNESQISLEFSNIQTWYILEQIIDRNSNAFDVLRHFGNMFSLPKDFKILDSIQDELKPFQGLLHHVLKHTPL